MADSSAYLGRWAAHDGRVIEVAASGPDLELRFPGVPVEFAPRAVAGVVAGDPAFTVRGGPYDGLGIAVEDRGSGPRLVVGGTVTLQRWTAGPGGWPSVDGLTVPTAAVDPGTEAAYRALLAEALAAGGGVVAPPAGGLAGWVRWVSDQQVVLFHGTADGGIDEFVPRRVSFELQDEAGRGNRGAVYATEDGWWALWFAVIDRDRLRGSMRNGVEVFTGPDGRALRVYHFSLDRRVLPTRPWRDGWLYLLPPAGFEHMGVVPGGPGSHEWCRPAPVRPLARLPVTPADFPFLDRVSAHDDGDLLRLSDLADLFRARIDAGRATPGGVALRLRWDDELAAVHDEYLALGRHWMPDVGRELRRDADGSMWLHLDAPGDVAAMLRHEYADVLGDR